MLVSPVGSTRISAFTILQGYQAYLYWRDVCSNDFNFGVLVGKITEMASKLRVCLADCTEYYPYMAQIPTNQS